MQVITGVGGWPASIPEQARAAEAEGFDCLTCGELAHDSILTMTLAATATERIGLQTSVTIAFPRSPFVLAMQAWDLQHLSRGRFCLGLGSQVKGHNERRFGGTWSAPAPRMREYIRMMHGVWDSWQDGKPAEFLGKQYTYTLMTPNFNPGPIEFDRPKVGLAIVGPGMARVTGEVADIAMPHGGIMSDKYMRQVLLPAIREGLERSGRTWADIEVAESGYLILGEDDSEIEQKALGMRRTLSFYGSTRTYHKVLGPARTHGTRHEAARPLPAGQVGRDARHGDRRRHPGPRPDLHLRRPARFLRRAPGVRVAHEPRRRPAGDAGAGGAVPGPPGAGAGRAHAGRAARDGDVLVWCPASF